MSCETLTPKLACSGWGRNSLPGDLRLAVSFPILPTADRNPENWIFLFLSLPSDTEIGQGFLPLSE